MSPKSDADIEAGKRKRKKRNEPGPQEWDRHLTGEDGAPEPETGGGGSGEEPPTGEDGAEPAEAEGPFVPVVVDVLANEPSAGPGRHRRRVLRREARPLTPEERRIIDDSIVEYNHDLRELENHKAAMTKKYNGEIAEKRKSMDDAIDVLGRDCVEQDFTRLEEFDYASGIVTYRDVETEEVIDVRPMTEDERQTHMNF